MLVHGWWNEKETTASCECSDAILQALLKLYFWVSEYYGLFLHRSIGRPYVALMTDNFMFFRLTELSPEVATTAHPALIVWARIRGGTDLEEELNKNSVRQSCTFNLVVYVHASLHALSASYSSHMPLFEWRNLEALAVLKSRLFLPTLRTLAFRVFSFRNG